MNREQLMTGTAEDKKIGGISKLVYYIPNCSWHDASACKNRILNQGKWYGHIKHLPTYVVLKVCINLFFLKESKLT